MQIRFFGRNTDISDTVSALFTKKAKKLDKYFKPETEMNVTMGVEKLRHIIEVTIPLDGSILRAEVSTDDMYTSVDKVLAKLEKQVVRHRTRLEKRIKEGSIRIDQPEYNEVLEPESFEETKPSISKIKRFNLDPMTPEEAVRQMDMLGHAFYVFLNEQTGFTSVVYLRNDGDYGLIDPEL